MLLLALRDRLWRFARSIDGIVVKVKTFDDIKSHEDFLFVEVKTTKSKDVTELPYGAFFGFTQNEEALFKSLVNSRLCIVHTILEDFYLLDYSEYESMISRKRVQYQINLNESELLVADGKQMGPVSIDELKMADRDSNPWCGLMV